MKRVMFVMLVGLLFSSCDKNDDWDTVRGRNIDIKVENVNGDDLLDPEIEGNILDDEIYIDYEGEKFPLRIVQTRVVPLSMWHGFSYQHIEGYPPRMTFGQFSPVMGYYGETFTIHLGDGTSNEVKFDLFIRGKKVKRTLWIDGELVSDDSLVGTIVK